MPLMLSIDGGGVRGIFAARVVARLDEARPGWRDRVRLYAGTSTGSIIAAGLADSRTPTELVELYRTQARAIFDDSFIDDLADLGRATGADYELTNLRRVLTELFGTRLLRSLGARVLIPAVELDGQVEFGRRTVRRFKPKFFHNFRGSDSDGAEKIVDVVTRSCAAPTYFPSEQGYIDGGVVANNPSMCALAQALSRDGLNAAIDELSLISIGTGIDEVYVDAGRSGRLNWGWGQWARPLVSIM
ncbi:MAG: patatin-like phospholipase family protein, partial [Phycisphaerales bacterium]|nr:patatin-like phospholipase family protein [Phycisphaerales bacterium]